MLKIKQGLRQRLLTGNYRLPQFEGAEWVDIKIGELGQLSKNSIDPQQFKDEQFWEYSMPAYDENKTPVRVYGNQMNSARFTIFAPILLFNKLNVRQKRVWFIDECEQDSICSTEFLPFISSKVDLYFLMELLLTDKVTFDFENMSTGTSNSQKRISPDSFLEYEIKIPKEKEEQEQIALILRDVNNDIKVFEEEIEKYMNIKQGMISYFLEN